MPQIIESPNSGGYELRGDCRAYLSWKGHESILAGARDCGKTIAACILTHLICLMCPEAQGGIVRKTYNALKGTVLQTFDRIIANQGVVRLGGENPTRYIYPNGSSIWLGGMDNPGRVLSSERDFIYVNQAEEMMEGDWETLGGSCSGRSGKVEVPRLFGDCNPAGSKHWIKRRAADGKLKLFTARHVDNPTLFDADGKILPGAQARLDVLAALTGVRRKRYFEGIWATTEGAVFENFDASIHTDAKELSWAKRCYLAMDEGFTNPAVILLIGDDADGRRHVFREFYKRGVLQEVVVLEAQRWFTQYRCELAAVDDAAAGLIASLKAAGVLAKGGKGRIIDGINKIQNRLSDAGDGKVRLTIDPSCTNTIAEFESHIWQPDKPKDTPVDADNHSIASLRYLEDVLAEPRGSIDTAAGIYVQDNRPLGTARVYFPPRIGPK